MKYLIQLLLLLPSTLSAQKPLDTHISVKVADTTGLYEKVRMAFVNLDFIIKDNRNKDTLSTYPAHIKSTTYILSNAVIKNDMVTIWGFFADTHGNVLGATVMPKKSSYQKIFYYKKDKYWNKLMSVARQLNGNISYSKQ